MEGVNSNMIHIKNLCKCHNVPPPRTTIKANKEREEEEGE
jgi:hypothetical protein